MSRLCKPYCRAMAVGLFLLSFDRAIAAEVVSSETRAKEEPLVIGSDKVQIQTLPIPSGVETAIMAAPNTSDVFSVTQNPTVFAGQILKTDVLVFQPGTQLILTNFSQPWIAVVAKTIQFVDPQSSNGIALSSSFSPTRFNPPAPPKSPGQAPGGTQCNAGANGAPGAGGTTGHNGDSAPKAPLVYVITGNLVDRNGAPIPQVLNLSFDVRGYSGGAGGDGSQGAKGGQGGDGGGSQFVAFPIPTCHCGAGDGGRGGPGGKGAPGGIGGDASAGADMFWDGPQTVLDSLYWSRVYNQGMFGGSGGFSGPSDPSGDSGPRGGWQGTCQGGSSPPPIPTPATPSRLLKNADGSE
jgi:hypothetical protein